MESNNEIFNIIKGKVHARGGFIRRLLELLENQSLSRAISWSKEEDAIVIKDIDFFASNILPKFYKHNKLDNFIRLLNMYGFKKTKVQMEKSQALVYKHPFFIRGRSEMISLIERKKKTSNGRALKPLQSQMAMIDSSCVDMFPSTLYNLKNEISYLNQEFKGIKRKNSVLMNNLVNMEKLSLETSKYSDKLETLIELINLRITNGGLNKAILNIEDCKQSQNRRDSYTLIMKKINMIEEINQSSKPERINQGLQFQSLIEITALKAQSISKFIECFTPIIESVKDNNNNISSIPTLESSAELFYLSSSNLGFNNCNNSNNNESFSILKGDIAHFNDTYFD